MRNEGYWGLLKNTSRPKGADGDYGAYYDSLGILTTGFGYALWGAGEKIKKGSKEERQKIEEFRTKYGYDPLTLSKEQSIEMLPKVINGVIDNAIKNTKNGGNILKDIDIENLPPAAQAQAIDIIYQHGYLGNNTAKALQQASTSKKKEDWDKFASELENWYSPASFTKMTSGMSPERAERFTKALKGRRKRNADAIRRMEMLDKPIIPAENPVEREVDTGESVENYVMQRDPVDLLMAGRENYVGDSVEPVREDTPVTSDNISFDEEAQVIPQSTEGSLEIPPLSQFIPESQDEEVRILMTGELEAPEQGFIFEDEVTTTQGHGRNIAAYSKPSVLPEMTTPEEMAGGLTGFDLSETPAITDRLDDQEVSAYLNRDINKGTPFDQPTLRDRLESSKEVKKDDRGYITKFADNLVNAFMTENIIGTAVKKAVINWDITNEYQEGFDPTKVQGFSELIKGIPNEDLKEIINTSYNERQLQNKLIGYNIEAKARQEMGEYFDANPVSGFVGVGIASILDVTTFIPVNGIAKAAGMTKSFRTVPHIMRNIGAQVTENVVQDLIQESVLTANSDIRRWDDGEILLGASFGAVMGGVAGAFKHLKDIGRFDRMAKQFITEKNLDQATFMLNKAKEKNLDPKIISNLEQTKLHIEQQLEKELHIKAYSEILEEQRRIGSGILQTEEARLLKGQVEHELEMDRLIEIEHNRVIGDLDNQIKQARQSGVSSSASLKQREKELQAQLSKERKALKRAKPLEGTSEVVSDKLDTLTRKLEEVRGRIDKTLTESNAKVKALRAEKAKVVRQIQSGSFTNEFIEGYRRSNVEARDARLAEYANIERAVSNNQHPAQLSLLDEFEGLDTIKAAGLDNVKTLDDLDEVLGLEFNDSLSAARTKKSTLDADSDFLDRQHMANHIGNLPEELQDLIRVEARMARENPALGLSSHEVSKNSLAAQMMRHTRLSEVLTSNSVVGRMVLNKSALRTSPVATARAFYNWIAPDGAGRTGAGRFSVFERQQQLANIYGGRMRLEAKDAIEKISDLANDNEELRKVLGLSSNRLLNSIEKFDVSFGEDVSKLLREEFVTSGSIRAKFGDEVGEVIEGWKEQVKALNNEVLQLAHRSGVSGVEDFIDVADENWFHRQWDNRAVRQFDMTYGTRALRDLVEDGMVKKFEEMGVEITPAFRTQINNEAKKFSLGIREADLYDNQMEHYANLENFVDSLIERHGKFDETVARKEIERIETNKIARERRELGKRTSLSLEGQVTLPDGKVVTLKDLLESNMLASQDEYLKRMSARIAAAENGVNDLKMLDQWKNSAVSEAMSTGDIRLANYINNAMSEDIAAFKAGGVTAKIRGGEDGLVTLARFGNKYNAARLLNYTGISSIGEVGKAISQAGYRAMWDAVTPSINKHIKSFFLGGLTGKPFRDQLSDELSHFIGVGLEDFNFDAIYSSSKAVSTSNVGKTAERMLDNSLKLMGRTTKHIETQTRKLTLNALSLSMGNAALGRSRIGSLFGGLSRQNMLEMGLADIVNGKAVPNENWNKIVKAIKDNATDMNGAIASTTGEPIRNFNLKNWDLETRTTFAKAINQWANHILVNPDPTTAKLWNSSLLGSVINQFKTFTMNASSKVAGHNLNQALQGAKRGELAEASKYIQTMFWSAVMGKLSYAMYGALDNAGREDFEERMEKYLSVSEVNDWTRALGRSSAVAGFDSVFDTGVSVYNLLADEPVEPFFDYSTIGQSRSIVDVQTTPTGQLLTGTQNLGKYVLQGEGEKAGKQALKLSPFRRVIIINQLLNAIGVD